MKKQKSRQGSQRRSGRFNKDTRQSASGDQRSVSIYDTDASGAPIRPPRRKKKSGKVSGSESSVAGSILQRRKSVRSSVRSNRSIRSSRRGGGGGAGSGPASGTRSGPVSYNPSGPPSFVSDHPFRRSGQLRRMNSRGQADFSRRGSRRGSKRNIGGGGAVASGRTPGFTTGNTAQGDVYTRVAIPRSKSFMNVNSQYNLQVCSIPYYNIYSVISQLFGVHFAGQLNQLLVHSCTLLFPYSRNCSRNSKKKKAWRVLTMSSKK